MPLLNFEERSAQVTRWLLVRHGKTRNPENRCYGWRDIPMDETGARAMAELAERLRDAHLDAVLCSDLARTRAGAAYFAAPRDLTVEAIPELREIHFGDIEGLTFAEAEARFPETTRRWVERPEAVKFPNGECFDDVCARVVPWCERRTARGAGERALFVTHSGTIRAMLRWMTGCDPHATLMVKIGYGDVVACEWSAAEGVWTRVEKWDAATGARRCVRALTAGAGRTTDVPR
jgi:probable phosphoglycerate mutase